MVALHPAHSSVADEPEDAPASERLSAEIASEGFARGPSYAMRRDPWRKLFERARIAQPTLEDLQRAIVTTNKQLEAMQMRVEEQLSELASLIFEAQILMLKDPQFIGGRDSAHGERRDRCRAGTQSRGHALYRNLAGLPKFLHAREV